MLQLHTTAIKSSLGALRIRTAAIVIALLITVLASVAWFTWNATNSIPNGANPTADALADVFLEIVDLPEIGDDRELGARKWVKPIEFNIIGERSPALETMVEGQMKHLSELSGVPMLRKKAFVLVDRNEGPASDDRSPITGNIKLLEGRSENDHPERGINVLLDDRSPEVIVWRSNYALVLGDRMALIGVFRQLPLDKKVVQAFIEERIKCFTFLRFEAGSNAIRTAIVLVRTDMGERMTRRCLVEETTQSLGLVNDVYGSTLTLFDDMPERGRTELTVYDEIFLRVLYHPELKLGMSGKELRDVSRRLIAAELNTMSGTIESKNRGDP